MHEPLKSPSENTKVHSPDSGGMKHTHWQYVKKSGIYTECPKCGKKGYVHAVRNFDRSLQWRTVHNKGMKPRTCWLTGQLIASLPLSLLRPSERR